MLCVSLWHPGCPPGTGSCRGCSLRGLEGGGIPSFHEADPQLLHVNTCQYLKRQPSSWPSGMWPATHGSRVPGDMQSSPRASARGSEEACWTHARHGQSQVLKAGPPEAFWVKRKGLTGWPCAGSGSSVEPDFFEDKPWQARQMILSRCSCLVSWPLPHALAAFVWQTTILNKQKNAQDPTGSCEASGVQYSAIVRPVDRHGFMIAIFASQS